MRDRLRRQYGSSLRHTGAAAIATLLLALSLGVIACGSQSPQRSDFDAILAPERCGGVKDACG
jgi:hypothetical protein